MLEWIEKLMLPVALASGERPVAELIEAEIAPYVDELRRDPLGNLLCTKKGTVGDKTILFSAHMDEAGFAVTYVTDGESLDLAAVGEPALDAADGASVTLENGTHAVLRKNGDGEVKNARDLHAALSDISGTVCPGDFLAYSHTLKQQDTLLTGTPLSARVPCAVLIDAAKQLNHPRDNIVFAFTVQGEVGFRGAKAAAFNSSPDSAVTVGICPESETLISGEGIALKLMDGMAVCDRETVLSLEAAAKRAGISVRYELDKEPSEAFVYQSSGFGAKTAGISLVCRNPRGTQETLSLRDCEDASALICAFLEEKKNEYRF